MKKYVSPAMVLNGYTVDVTIADTSGEEPQYEINENGQDGSQMDW